MQGVLRLVPDVRARVLAGPGEVVLLVGAAVEQGVVRDEPLFRAVAVVHVKVDHGHLACPVRVLRVPAAKIEGVVVSTEGGRGACSLVSCAYLAPIAALLKKQKPHARLRSAWWPGGRTQQKADRAVPPVVSSLVLLVLVVVRVVGA